MVLMLKDFVIIAQRYCEKFKFLRLKRLRFTSELLLHEIHTLLIAWCANSVTSCDNSLETINKENQNPWKTKSLTQCTLKQHNQ